MTGLFNKVGKAKSKRLIFKSQANTGAAREARSESKREIINRWN